MKRLAAILVLTEASRDLLAVDMARLPAEHRPPQARLDTILEQSRSRIAGAVRAGVTVAFGSDLYIDFGISRGAAVLLALRAYVDGA
jgi:hypothetical protein